MRHLWQQLHAWLRVYQSNEAKIWHIWSENDLNVKRVLWFLVITCWDNVLGQKRPFKLFCLFYVVQCAVIGFYIILSFPSLLWNENSKIWIFSPISAPKHLLFEICDIVDCEVVRGFIQESEKSEHYALRFLVWMPRHAQGCPGQEKNGNHLEAF